VPEVKPIPVEPITSPEPDQKDSEFNPAYIWIPLVVLVVILLPTVACLTVVAFWLGWCCKPKKKAKIEETTPLN
jgi:flagellar basal body-associated protein FliL